MKKLQLQQGDCLDLLKRKKANSVNLVMTSPPYSNQRRYGSNKPLFRDDYHWLDWTAGRFMECLRVCSGPVCFVVEGYTKGGRFHPLPELLTAEIQNRGAVVRQRYVYQRVGIPGGSPDELAQHHEIIVRATSQPGRLPYSDPTACGHVPKYGPGGRPSHHGKDGRVSARDYQPPKLAKASNVINCGAVGGGNIGSRLAHQNEAPFSEQVAAVIVKTFCPPGGVVLDPFCGSGTTGAVAMALGRKFIGMDIRQSQVDLARKRIEQEAFQ